MAMAMAMAARRAVAAAAVLAAAALAPAGPVRADVEEAGRERYFRLCSKCHGRITEHGPGARAGAAGGATVWPAVMMVLGPNLTGVVGRKAGAVRGYRYSKAFRKAAPGLVWTRPALERWLADPDAVAPGTFMLFRTRDPADRRLVLDYLEAFARHRPEE